jgi:hypothetical protein
MNSRRFIAGVHERAVPSGHLVAVDVFGAMHGWTGTPRRVNMLG